ncbi:retrovirus-related pol polyprotein from transposon TNT 1-94 [Tanacetum coccineum]
MKQELVAHQEKISIMSQEKEAQKKFYKTHKDKEIEKVIALENKVKVLDDIVYKTGQSVQTMNVLNHNCKTSFVKPEFLKKAQRTNPRLYDISCYNDNLALMLAPESDESIRLAQESRSKLSDLIKPFDYKNLNNLYDLFVPQHEKSAEQRYFSKRGYYYPDHMNAILGMYTKLDEVTNLQCDYLEQVEKCERLEKELSKRSKNVNNKSFNELFESLASGQEHRNKTKQPIDVPISAKEPKRTVNQFVATSLKKIVASESTKKKPRKSIRKLHEHLIEIIMFIIDSGCSKHMTGNLKLLSSTVKFGNDQIAPILGYGDLGNDLLIGSRGTDLYSITLQNTSTPNLICLMAKASSSQAWLWHLRLSQLNFDTINLLSKYDIVTGLPKLKFVKDHLCSSCELGKAKHKSFKTKTTSSSKRRLQILHMDLCGPMKVESFNGKKYVLVIVDDYSRYTWTHFLRSKDETTQVLIDFLKLVQRGLHAQVRTVRTDKGTEFLNNTLHEYFAQEDGENLDKMKEKGDACIFVDILLSQELTEFITSLSPFPQSQENVPQAAESVTTSNELDLLFSLMFDELFNGSTLAVSKSSAILTADASDKRQRQQDSTSSTPTLATTVTTDGNFNL